MDCDGPKIADSFYHSLLAAGSDVSTTNTLDLCPDTTRAARSLHLAVARLRSETPDFARWVPFVHFGL